MWCPRSPCLLQIQSNSDISNSVFTTTWCISKCYQGPNVTPDISNFIYRKHGYIEVFLRSHAIEINVNYLPYIEVWNKVIEISWSSPFRDQHFKINWHFSVSWPTYTIHISNTLKAISISQFRYWASAPLFLLQQFLHDWREQWLDYHTGHSSQRRQYHANKQDVNTIPSWLQRTMIGLFSTASSLSCKHTMCKNRNIMLYKWFRWIE